MGTRAEKMLKFIQDGGEIVISTYLKSIMINSAVLKRFEKASATLLKTDSKGSTWIARGKNFDCIDGCAIKAYK